MSKPPLLMGIIFLSSLMPIGHTSELSEEEPPKRETKSKNILKVSEEKGLTESLSEEQKELKGKKAAERAERLLGLSQKKKNINRASLKGT